MTPPAKRSSSKTLSLLMIMGLLALVVVLDVKRRGAENQLAQLTMRLDQVNGGNNAKNLEAAKEIVAAVGKLMEVPKDVEPTVATIVDVESLRKQNDFYKQAENGDFLVVWPTRAVLYRKSANKIIDVVPVNLQAPQGQGQAGAATQTQGQPQAQPQVEAQK